MRKNFITFLLIILLMIVAGCGSGTGISAGVSTDKSEESTLFELPKSGTYDSEGTVIVTKVSEINKTITFYDYEVGKSFTLNYDGVTRFSDRYDTAMAVSQVKKGSIVDILFLKTNKSLVSLHESEECFVLTDVTGVDINISNKVFKYNNEAYKITKDTVLISENGSLSLNDINTLDRLTVTGIGKSILSIIVDSGHGYLGFSGEDYFIDGFVEIGSKQIEKITDKMLIMVPEGQYSVRITKKGTEVLRAISIKSGEETVIDLSDVEIAGAKMGTVVFAINPIGATLMVDGIAYDHTRKLSFEYGIHQLTISCTGYETLTRYINVGAETATLSITLDEKPDTSKENEESKTEGHFVYITAPLDVEVYVDNTYIGLSPVAFAKVAGIHTITLRKTGYETRSFNISLENTADDVRYAFDNLAEVKSDSTATEKEDTDSTTSTEKKDTTSSTKTQTDTTVSGTTTSSESADKADDDTKTETSEGESEDSETGTKEEP